MRQQTISQTDVALPDGQAYEDIDPMLPFHAFPQLKGSFGNFARTKEIPLAHSGHMKTY